MPDVGHGNCVSIFNDEASLIVDCGAENNDKVESFFNFVELKLKNSKKRELIITHYHFDHYNLLSKLPPSYFERVYLPKLPLKERRQRQYVNFWLYLLLQGSRTIP